MQQLDVLGDRFGAERVLGGLCVISATLGAEGAIVHLNEVHSLTFGELDPSQSQRIERIAPALSGANFDARLSPAIRQEMWEKWVFIASAAGATCLMRAAIGDIAAAGASDLATALLDECAAIATHEGFPPRAPFLERTRAMVSGPGFAANGLDAARYRKRQPGRGRPYPRRSPPPCRDPKAHSLLRVADLHVRAYEARRMRNEAAAAG